MQSGTSIFDLLYSNIAWAAANRARFDKQLTYDNPFLLHNFMDFPSCSPHIPIFRSFLVEWPLSLVNIIISPTPSSSFAAYGLFFIILYSRYCDKKLLESSLLIQSVVCVRLFVPKLKNSSWGIYIHFYRGHLLLLPHVANIHAMEGREDDSHRISSHFSKYPFEIFPLKRLELIKWIFSNFWTVSEDHFTHEIYTFTFEKYMLCSTEVDTWCTKLYRNFCLFRTISIYAYY